MEVFKSKNGIFYKVLEWAECPKHGRYVSRIAEWRSKNEFGLPWSCVCQACRDEAQANRMFSQVAIPPRFQGKTIESFQAGTEKAAEVKQFFADYAANLPECIRDGRSVILTGRCGTGKTHLACALALDAKAMGFTALFTSVAKIVRNIRESWGSASGASERQIIDRYAGVDLLIIDEVGVQNNTDNERNLLFSVLNERYEQIKPTILISNLKLSEIKAVIGERAFDRIRENGGRAFVFDWESWRPDSKAAEPVRYNPLARLHIEAFPDDAEHPEVKVRPVTDYRSELEKSDAP